MIPSASYCSRQHHHSLFSATLGLPGAIGAIAGTDGLRGQGQVVPELIQF